MIVTLISMALRTFRAFGAVLVAVLVVSQGGSSFVRAQGAGAQTDAAADDAPAVPKRTVIRFVTDSTYPPFNYLDEDNVLTGFNVSVARAICLELDVTCEITARDWADLLPSLESGEADAVIASISRTPETLQRASFTVPYHFTPARFAVRRNTPKFELEPTELEGRQIGVVAGTAHEAFLRTYFPDAEITTYPGSKEARTALRLGRLELLFGDAAGLALWMNGTDARGCCGFRGGAYNEPLFFGDGVSIAVRRGDASLMKDLNQAIGGIRKNRRLEEIFLQFFPIKIY